MNKKILVIPVLLLAFALISIPVMGAPATKIEGVTLTAAATPIPDDTRWVSHDTIRHARGTSTGTVTLNIPGQDPLPGDWYSEWANVGKFKQDPAELVIRGKVVLTFPGKGTFKGVIQRTIIGYPVSGSSYFIDHMVLQGTDAFQGQTLKLSYEGTPPVISEGYLIIPK
jgi:hypothetical protein